jgi:hypothetical protein
MTNGLQFDVTVSNVRPHLGEAVSIHSRVLNLSNLTLQTYQWGYKFTLRIVDGLGNTIWQDYIDAPPPPTTPGVTLGTGTISDLTRTWVAGNYYSILTTGFPEISPGTITSKRVGNYTLYATFEVFYLYSMTVTPIQITVSG